MKTKDIIDNKVRSTVPEIENKIRAVFGSRVVKIILFGSYARGDYNNESDVDVLVLVDDKNLTKYRSERVKIISEFLQQYNLLLSIRIISATDFATYKEVIPFYQNVIAEGISLYG